MRQQNLYECIMGLMCVAMATAMTSPSHDPCTKFESFNMGLLSGVEETEGRILRIVDALESSHADFICLQEAWMETSVSVITQGLESRFPHHYSALHHSKDVLRKPSSSGEGWISWKDKSCDLYESISAYTRVILCAFINGCISKPSGVLAGICIAEHCPETLREAGISDSCVTCIFMNSARNILDGIKQCALPQTSHNRMNEPGLLVLSKQPLATVSYTNLFPSNRTIFTRGYITAELQNGMTAVCTHFSANLDKDGYMEYDLQFDTYESQQAYEIKRVLNVLGGADAVVLGDINAGPSVTHEYDTRENVMGDYAENFDLLMDAGFRSPYLEDNGRCTYCRENPLTKDSPNNLLDHVLVRGNSLTSSEVKL